MEIWINPACSKCRTAVNELDAAGTDYTVRRYLQDVPSAAEVGAVVDRLGIEPWDLARPKETREAGIDLPRDAAHRQDWLAALARHPPGDPAPGDHRDRRHHGRRPGPGGAAAGHGGTGRRRLTRSSH